MLVFNDQDPLHEVVKKTFHCLFLSKHRITTANRHRDNRRRNTSFSCGATQLLPQPFPSTSSGFATRIAQAATTGSVAHGFQRPLATENTVARKNFAFHCSEKTPWRSYSRETTQIGTLRPEETHSKLNSFDSCRSKAPQWLERILPSTGQKRHGGEATAKIPRWQGTLRHCLSDRF